MKPLGFTDSKPFMTRISFRKQGYMAVYFNDGRLIYVPLDRFPGIRMLTSKQRRQYHIAGGEFLLFQEDDEVYHVQNFLGHNTLRKNSGEVEPALV